MKLAKFFEQLHHVPVRWAIGKEAVHARKLIQQDMQDPENTVVWIDIKDIFSHMSKGFTLDVDHPRGGENGIGNRVPRAKMHWENGNFMDPATIRVNGNEITVGDGRHRLVAAHQMGEQAAPVIIRKDDLPALRMIVTVHLGAQNPHHVHGMDEDGEEIEYAHIDYPPAQAVKPKFTALSLHIDDLLARAQVVNDPKIPMPQSNEVNHLPVIAINQGKILILSNVQAIKNAKDLGSGFIRTLMPVDQAWQIKRICRYRGAETVVERLARAPLYRATDPKFALDALKTDQMMGYTTQRYWKDGKRRLDDDPEYETSFWMKGISTTRDIRYAEKWGGGVVFIFDQDKIKQNYEIVPYNWGYSIRSQSHRKREREEFIVLSKTGEDYMDHSRTQYGGKPRIDVQKFQAPAGVMKPLSKFLVGFKIRKGFMLTYSQHHDDERMTMIKELTEHPKFMGFYHLPEDDKYLTPELTVGAK